MTDKPNPGGEPQESTAEPDNLAWQDTPTRRSGAPIWMDVTFAAVGFGVALAAALASNWLITLLGIVFGTAGATTVRAIDGWARSFDRP